METKKIERYRRGLLRGSLSGNSVPSATEGPGGGHLSQRHWTPPPEAVESWGLLCLGWWGVVWTRVLQAVLAVEQLNGSFNGWEARG